MQRWTPCVVRSPFYGADDKSSLRMDPDGDWVKHEDAHALLAAKDAEIERLKGMLVLCQQQRDDARARCTNMPVAAKIESLATKCAKMREILTQAKDSLRVGTPEGHKVMVAKIDAILESEESDDA